MESLGGGTGGFLGWNFPLRKPKPFKSRSKKSNSAEATGGAANPFPLKQALTAGTLAFTGDTIAQGIQRWNKRNHYSESDFLWTIVLDHDWFRALRMTSYGFLLYGPGSYAWYKFLDHCMPKQTVENVMLKVLLNQIVLGPSVIAVCFAWNSLWQGKLSELPNKYKNDALPTLLYGFRFWIPVSALNFWYIFFSFIFVYSVYFHMKKFKHNANLSAIKNRVNLAENLMAYHCGLYGVCAAKFFETVSLTD